MGIFDKLKGKDKTGTEKKETEDGEENDEFAGIIDEAANEALTELGLAGDEETGKQVVEGFGDEAGKEIDEEVKKGMESEGAEKQIEDEVKKKFGFLG